MKLKYTGTEPDLEISLSLVDHLKESKIILSDEDIIGVDDKVVELANVYPSESLSQAMELYPEYSILTTPDETDPFMVEPGLPDVNKIGTVPTQDTLIEGNDEVDFNEIQLFSDSEIEDTQEESDPNTNNLNSKMRKKFNEVNPDTQEELDVKDVDLFTEEELEGAEAGEDQPEEPGVLTEEEIEELKTIEDVESATEEIESADETFCEEKKRLFAAKRKLRRVNSKYASRKSFTEELTEKEQSEVIGDIVAILQDSPEILGAVSEEVEMLRGPEAFSNEESVEEPVEEPVVEPTTEPSEEPVEEPTNEDCPECFTDEEIESAEGDAEYDDLEDDSDDEDEFEGSHVGNVFARAFSANNVAATRRAILDEMRTKTRK